MDETKASRFSFASMAEAHVGKRAQAALREWGRGTGGREKLPLWLCSWAAVSMPLSWCLCLELVTNTVSIASSLVRLPLAGASGPPFIWQSCLQILSLPFAYHGQPSTAAQASCCIIGPAMP